MYMHRNVSICTFIIGCLNKVKCKYLVNKMLYLHSYAYICIYMCAYLYRIAYNIQLHTIIKNLFTDNKANKHLDIRVVGLDKTMIIYHKSISSFSLNRNVMDSTSQQ